MRIGITCYPSYGGSGVVATELGRQLAQRGHAVHFITYDVPFRLDRFQENVFFHEVEVPTYPLFKYPPYLLALANKMVEVSRYQELDVMHVHYAIPHATSAYLARQMLRGGAPGGRLKVVTTLHGTDITLVGSDPSFRDIIAFSLTESDGVTAVSHALRRQTQETFKVDVDIEVIHNFIDPADYNHLERVGCRRCVAGAEELVVSHISNFRPVKRTPLVVRMFAQAARDLPARLVLIGDGPDIPQCHEEATRLGIDGRVTFLGRQERVNELLAASDVFLLPSLEESFGLAALEAMAAGTPVIATRVGGLPEVVGDVNDALVGAGIPVVNEDIPARESPATAGWEVAATTGTRSRSTWPDVGGLTYEVDDIEGMTRGLRSLLTDHTLRAGLSERARRRALARFSSDEIVERYEAFYRRVLKRPAR